MAVVEWIAMTSISNVREESIEPFVYRDQDLLEPIVTFFDWKYPRMALRYARDMGLLSLAKMSSKVVFTADGVCEDRLNLIHLSRRRPSSNITDAIAKPKRRMASLLWASLVCKGWMLSKCLARPQTLSPRAGR